MIKFLKSSTIILTLALLLAANVVDYFQKANAHMAKKNYILAIEMYEKALESSSVEIDKNRKTEIVKGLALAHLKTKNYLVSEIYFEKLMAADSEDPEVLLSYAKMLQIQKRYSKAIDIYNTWGIIADQKLRANEFKSACNKLLSGEKSSEYFVISPLDFNSSKYSEFAPFIHPNGYLVFTSDRPAGKSNRVKINGKRSTTLFRTTSLLKEESGQVSRIKSLDKNIYNQGSACYDATGNKMFYTANVIKDIEMFSKDNVQYTLGIYESQFDGFKWSDPVLLNFFKADFNCAYPSVSTNGDTIVFSSDAPGGAGGMDLYMAVRRGDKWSQAENLGSEVNSSGNDVFPFVVPSGNVNEIYFASDGRPGKGGLDVFSTVSVDFIYSDPNLLPGPINSSYDDFGYCSSLNNSFGFFSTNREGTDDIYFFSNNGYEPNHSQSKFPDSTQVLVYDDTNKAKESEPKSDIKYDVDTLPTVETKSELNDEKKIEPKEVTAEEIVIEAVEVISEDIVIEPKDVVYEDIVIETEEVVYKEVTIDPVQVSPPTDGREYKALIDDSGEVIGYELIEPTSESVYDEKYEERDIAPEEGEGVKERIFVDGKAVYVSKGAKMAEIHAALIEARSNKQDYQLSTTVDETPTPYYEGPIDLSKGEASGYFIVFYSARNPSRLKGYRDQYYKDATFIEGKNGFYMLAYPLAQRAKESRAMFNDMKSRFSQAWLYKAR